MTQKFKMSKLTLAASAAVLAALLWAPSAQAIVVGNGAGQPTMTSHDLELLVPFVGWFVREPDNGSLNPIPVSYDPTAGPWEKTLNLVLNGEEFPVAEFGSPPDTVYNGFLALIEVLTVDGDTPWTDWHEEILTPGWDWIIADFFQPTILFLSNGEEPVPGLDFSLSDGMLDFSFDPLQPGTEIGIVKGLIFTGIDDNVIETTTDPVRIREYPTVPEPSTFILLGAGLAGLAFWRKKRV